MTSNSKQNIQETTKHRKAKNLSFKRIGRKCRLAYKSILNKIMTTHE